MDTLVTLSLDASTPADIVVAARLLREGGVVVIPTDTLYGLAASIFRPDAVERIYEIKQRPSRVPLPVLLATAQDLSIVARSVPRVAWSLIHAFWPGSLTLVLPARAGLSPFITGGGSTVAVRVPAHRGCLQLLETLGEPIIGTSANLHGQPAARTASEARQWLDGGVDAVVIDESTPVLGLPSTVLEVSDELCTVHRPGAVDIEAIRRIVGRRVRVIS